MNFREWNRFAKLAMLIIVGVVLMGGYFYYQDSQRKLLFNQPGMEELTELDTPSFLTNIPTKWQESLGFAKLQGIRVARDTQVEAALQTLEVERVVIIETFDGSHPFTDKGLALLKQFPNLKRLHLKNTSITDEGLQVLGDFQSLEEIIFENNQKMTGSGLKYLKGANSLKLVGVQRGIEADVLWEAMCEVPQVKEIRWDSRSEFRFDMGDVDITKLTQPVNWRCFLPWGEETSLEVLPHLKFLSDVPQVKLKGGRIDKQAMEEMIQCQGVLELSLDQCIIDEDAVPFFRHLDTLTHIYLEECEFAPEMMKEIAQLPLLKKVICDDCPLDDTGLEFLSAASGLKSLSLTNTQVTDAGLVHLGKLEFLEELILSGGDFDGSWILQIIPLQYLRTLEIDSPRFRNEAVEQLTRFPVMALSLKGNEMIAPDSIANLANLEFLAVLDVGDNVLDHAALRTLKRSSHLRQLNFRINDVTEELLEELEQDLWNDAAEDPLSGSGRAMVESARAAAMANWLAGKAAMDGQNSRKQWRWRINLSESNITDEGLARILQNRTITYLDLTDTAISDAAFTQLESLAGGTGQLPNELILAGTQITDAGLAALSGTDRSTKLRYLDLSRTAITSAGVEYLSHLQQVSSLNLAHTSVDDSCVPALKKMGTLRTLNLEGTKISPEGIAELQKSLTRTTIQVEFESTENSFYPDPSNSEGLSRD
ncbi:MAG: hypothetical protein CMJ46_12910 [Planctomyces sp.]|nr:hypothetical protein [Planctomyces sp.]